MKLRGVNYKMKLVLNKGTLIIVIAVVLIAIGVYWYISFHNNDKRQYVEKTYEITTSLNDKFFISEKLLGIYPEYTYDIEVFYYTNSEKKTILNLDNVEKDTDNDEIDYLFSSDDVRAYSYLNYIIYKEKSSDYFKSLWLGDVEKLDTDEYSYLIPVAIEITHKNWKFAHLVSEFIVKSKEPNAVSIIKKYAKGEFSSEEIEDNKYSGFSIQEMQEYFENLLIKYNLQN